MTCRCPWVRAHTQHPTGRAHTQHTCPHGRTVSSHTRVCAPRGKLRGPGQERGQPRRSLSGSVQLLTTLSPPGPRPALLEPTFTPSSSYAFFPCAPELGSATRLCWDLVIFTAAGRKLSERREGFAKRLVPNALSHGQPSPGGQTFPGSAGMVAVVSLDQPQHLPEGPSLTSWLSATTNSSLRTGDTLV